MEALRTLIVRYPFVLSKTTDDLKAFFETLKSQGLTEEESMKALLECPKLISKRDLAKQIKEIQFLFRLYHGITEQELTEVFRSFPYLYLCDQIKVQKFLGAFRHYKMSKDQILNLVRLHLRVTMQCKHNGGVLASRVSAFTGLFDLLKKQHKIKASDIVDIINAYPEFVL